MKQCGNDQKIMDIIIKIAWRNIWRNITRSLVVIGAIVIGVWSIIFLVGMVNGMIDSYVDNAIKNEVSHIKIHHPEFIKDKESKFYIADVAAVKSIVDTIAGVKAVSYKSTINAMISSSHAGRGISAIGIVPKDEATVSGVSQRIIKGTYLTDAKKNQIIVSKRTAKKLKVKLRSKVVLTFQNLENEITMGAFRIVGIFETGNNIYDESVVFVRQSDINNLLNFNGNGHELAILINDLSNLDKIQTRIAILFPNLLVRNYKEIQPELALFQSQIKMAGIIYMVIFMLALIFGIINTMMMAVLERVRELGMLMSVGMNKGKVFTMIVVETLMLAIVAGPVGLVLGYVTTSHFNKNGINLFFYSEEGMKQFGFDKFIYPNVQPETYYQLIIAVSLTALLGSLYPAWKAISLRPVEAIRGSFTSQKMRLFKKLITFIKNKKLRK